MRQRKSDGTFTKTHGLINHKLYMVWANMKRRCYHKNGKDYKYYGGRGIIVCDEWLHNPEAFIGWAIANGWAKGLTIDREENDGDYTPDNCRFISIKMNTRNRRTTKMTVKMVQEMRQTKKDNPNIKQRELAKKYSVDRRTVGYILNYESWV